MKLRSRTTAHQPKAAEISEGSNQDSSEPKKKKARTTADTSVNEVTTTGNNNPQSAGAGAAAAAAPTSAAISTPEEWIIAVTQDDFQRRRELQGLHNLIRLHAPSLEPTLDFKDKLGYGKYHYQYKSGRQGDWVKIGISINQNKSKGNNKSSSISLHFCGLVNGAKYVLDGYTKQRLASKKTAIKSKSGGGGGIISIGKSCLRFQSVQDLDETTLIELIQATETADMLT